MRGMDRVDRQQLFPLIERPVTRGHKVKVRGGRFRGDLRKNVFTQRVVTVWNALPGRVVEAGCLTSFKRYLDEHLACHNVQGYGLVNGIRWEFRCFSSVSADLMGRRASSALYDSTIL